MRVGTARTLSLAVLIAVVTGGCGTQPPTEIAATSVPSTGLVLPTIPSFPTSGPTSTAAPTLSPLGPELDPLIEAARAEGQLTVMALPHDWMNYGEVIQTFASKYGIRVNEVQPGAGSLDELNAIRSARVTADPSAPDVIDVGMSFAEQARQQNLLQPYKVSTWSSIPEAAKDPEGYWYGDYYGIIVFEVNKSRVASVPADWADLLLPGNQVALAGAPDYAYEGMMAVYSASLANGGSLDDSLPGLRFFQEVNHNANLLKDVVATADTVASGETPIALRWDYLALANRKAHFSEIDVIAPRTGVVAGVYAQAISAYAAHPNAARLWMEFLYSDEGQMLFIKGLGHPIRFGDMLRRGVIPDYLQSDLLPADTYLKAEFPTIQQLSAADKSILGSWKSYIP